MLRDVRVPRGPATDAAAEAFVGSANTFIGLTDVATEGTFVWDDGTPLGYSNWHTASPTTAAARDDQEDCEC